MGKKVKTGKNRQDIFYKKAKEAGYRARAAFKLIQLNVKYDFLANSRVCLDLCAAPGSWMQVARKYMPVSSLIVGVDLVPIKTIPNTIAIQGDITSEKLRQDLKGTLKTWKADLVLHDGAPNVGQNWIFDAYQQNLLVLRAFKLACEFLQKGGCFVTKVFRSKDYFSLDYVFRKLFKRVESTKPQASRHESAEIFVVCQGFLAPDKVDLAFFDAKFVFQEFEKEPENKLNLLKPEKLKKKAHGYADGVSMLFKKVSASEFISSNNHIEVLQEASEFDLNTDHIRNHPLTTPEVVECCKDIKVLGRRELRVLLTWRKNIRSELEEEKKAAKPKEIEVAKEVETETQELEKVQQQIDDLEAEKAQLDKRARKRMLKSKRKLEEKLRLRAVIPGDRGPTDDGHHGLFQLKTLGKLPTLDKVIDQEADYLAESSSDEEEMGPTHMSFERGGGGLDESGKYYKQDGETVSDDEKDEDLPSDAEGCLGLNVKKGESVIPPNLSGDESDDSDDEPQHPLITDLVGDAKTEKRARKAENWFNKDLFKGIETDVDEDFELNAAIKSYESRGGKIRSKKQLPQSTNISMPKFNKPSAGTSSDEAIADCATDDDSDSSDSENEMANSVGPQLIGGALGNGLISGGEGKKKGNKRPLDAVGLALATKMIQSKKARREIIDASWNRYMYGDEDMVALPDWFESDERKHNTLRIEVEPEDLTMYRDRSKGVNVRTIKKVVEAKARKERRTKKRMDRAHKKSDVIMNNEDMSQREKSQEMQRVYKKALKPLKKKETKYVVVKKRHAGKKPAGTKGPYKLVDKRMKKEKLAEKRRDSKKSGQKRSKKGGHRDNKLGGGAKKKK